MVAEALGSQSRTTLDLNLSMAENTINSTL